MLIVPPTPRDLGLPSPFLSWRPNQAAAIQKMVNSEDRFIIQAHPTGAGKSVTYISAALLANTSRTMILTSTKALQDQLMRDFDCLGLVDIRGQNAYACRKYSGLSCAEGPCHWGNTCYLKDGGCDYYDAQRAARESRLVVTNYAYWMVISQFSEEDNLGDFDTLILDESHNAPAALMGYLTIDIELDLFQSILGVDLPNLGQDTPKWKHWATLTKRLLVDKNEELKQSILRGGADVSLCHRVGRLKRLERDLSTLIDRVQQNSWYFYRHPAGLTIGYIEPAKGWAEHALFCQIPRVIMVSATVRPRTAEMLGLATGQYSFEDYPSIFPRSQCPVYWLRTLRLNKNTPVDEVERIWAPQIDRIIGSRLDRKGIVHTHSYARVDILRDHSRYADIFYINNRYNTRAVVQEFRKAAPPAVMVSPVLTTGWDFPLDACEFQVIGKLPFPSLGDGLLAERVRRDKGLMSYLTMQNLVQACGRGMRSAEDHCENFIVDDSIEWWLKQNRALAPGWFLESYKAIRTIPKPPLAFYKKSTKEEEFDEPDARAIGEGG